MPGGRGRGSGRRNNRGRWTRQEHEQFLGGLEAVGETWCLVATYVPTRTELQIRTHAQKYFRKVRQGLPFPEEPYQSATESDGGDDDNAGAHTHGGAAADGSGEAGPHAPLPAAAASHHGPPSLAPSFDGHLHSYGSRSPGWPPIGGEGGHGGGAAPPFAPVPPSAAGAAAPPPMVNPNAACLAHNLDGVWLPGEHAHSAPVFMGQQHLHYQQQHQQQQPHQQELPPWRGYSDDMAGGGSFSPPHGEPAPFRNWPVADGDVHANLLHEYSAGDMGAPNHRHNHNHHHHHDDNNAAVAGAVAAAYRFL